MTSSMIIVATLAVVAALATPALASVKVRCSGGPMPQTCSGDHPVCCFASDASWAGCCAIGTKCDLKIEKCVIVNPPANMSMYTLSTATDDVHITRQSLLCVGVSFVMILVSVFGLVVCGIRVKERMRMYFIRRHLRQRRREDRGSSDVDSNGESVSDATVASAQDEQTWRRMRQRLQAEAQRLIEEENAALQRTSTAAQAAAPAAAVPRSATVATPGDGFTAVLVSAAPSSTTKAPAAAAYLATTSTTSTTNKKATPQASSSVNRTTSAAADRSVSLKNMHAGEAESTEDSASSSASSAASSELASPVGSIQHAAVAVVRSTDPSDDEAGNDDSDIHREVKSNASSTVDNAAADTGANGDDDDEGDEQAFSPRSTDNGHVNDDDEELDAAAEDNEPVAASAVVVEEPAQEEVGAAAEQPAVREALRVMMCRVCGAAPVDSILLPCSHAVVCLPCARGLKRCVDCKQLIKKRRKLYLASAD